MDKQSERRPADDSQLAPGLPRLALVSLVLGMLIGAAQWGYAEPAEQEVQHCSVCTPVSERLNAR